MILSQDVMSKIEQLTKQNEQFMREMAQIKSLLHNVRQNARSGGAPGRQNGRQPGGAEPDVQGGGRQSGGGPAEQPAGDQQEHWNQAAGELLRIKSLVQSLETNMTQYVQSQTEGPVTPRDIVQLLLTMMDAMITWAGDYISSQTSGQTH